MLLLPILYIAIKLTNVFEIVDFGVDLRICVRDHKIAEDDWFISDDVFVVEVKVLLHFLLE